MNAPVLLAEAPAQVCCFRIDRQDCGVDVALIRDVLRGGAVTTVPRSDPAIRGLMNLRSQVVVAIDLRIRLGMPPADPAATRMNIVVAPPTGGDWLASLVVDAVGDVVDVDRTAWAATPDAVRGPLRAVTRGVITRPQGLLLVLDVAALVAIAQGDAGPR